MSRWPTRQFIRLLHVAICLSVMLPLLLRPSALQHMIFNGENLAHGGLYLMCFSAALFAYFVASYTDPGYLTFEKARMFRHRRGNTSESGEQMIEEDTYRLSDLDQSDPGDSANSELSDPISLKQFEANQTGGDLPRGWLDLSHLARWLICPFSLWRSGEDQFDQPSTIFQLPVPVRFCKHCLLEQPLRCRHCPDCNRCVMKFDHHCPWIANCVGERNHSAFVIFLSLQTIVLWWTIYFAGASIIPIYPWHKWFHTNGLAFAELLLLTLLGIPLTGLLCFHIYLALASRTTWETMAYERIAYLKHLDARMNPFNQGCARNCYSFCCSPFPFAWDRVYAETIEKHISTSATPPVSGSPCPLQTHDVSPVCGNSSAVSPDLTELQSGLTFVPNQHEDAVVIISTSVTEQLSSQRLTTTYI